MSFSLLAINVGQKSMNGRAHLVLPTRHVTFQGDASGVVGWAPKGVMTNEQAKETLIELLESFNLLDCLEQWDDVIREQVREDGYTGLTAKHPKVLRFTEICRTLREASPEVRHSLLGEVRT